MMRLETQQTSLGYLVVSEGTLAPTGTIKDYQESEQPNTECPSG